MLTPKKAIPTLAVAVLALTGCGDSTPSGGGGSAGTGGTGGTAGMGGGGGTGGSLPDALANALRSFCMNVLACDSQTTYASVDDCAETYAADYASYILGNPNCEVAVTAFLECGGDLNCNDFLMETGCDDEYAAAATACDF
jgi:hypothetical protein